MNQFGDTYHIYVPADTNEYTTLGFNGSTNRWEVLSHVVKD